MVWINISKFGIIFYILNRLIYDKFEKTFLITRNGENMTNLRTYSAVKDPLKSKTIFSKKKNPELLSKEIQHRIKLIEKAFR